MARTVTMASTVASTPVRKIHTRIHAYADRHICYTHTYTHAHRHMLHTHVYMHITHVYMHMHIDINAYMYSTTIYFTY